MAKKIFLIENQSTQFDKIFKFLSDSDNDEFEVFPTKDKYIIVIDYVRIYLNDRYSTTNRQNAFNKIKEVIDSFNPDIFIIDHILVGNYFGKNGIDLAIDLRSNGYIQPILFLSNTKPNTAEVISNFPKIAEPKDWVHKGYAGDEILKAPYFNKNVISKINKMLADGVIIVNSTLDNLESMINRNNLTYLSKIGFTNEKKSLISLGNLLKKCKDISINEEIEICINNLLKDETSINNTTFVNKVNLIITKIESL